MPYSWLYCNQVKNVSKTKTGIDYHPCVIPDDLTAIFVNGMTKPGETVVIPFAGSGSELIVVRKLGRNFISSEIDSDFCDRIEKRLDTQLIDLI